MKDLIRKIIKEISLKTLLASILFLVTTFIFAFIAHEVIGENEDVFDRKVFQFLATYTTPKLIHLMGLLSFFGTPYFLIPAYLLLIIFLFLKKKNSEAIDIAIIAVSSTVIMIALKRIFHRQRPDLPFFRELDTYSFPSGHAVSSFIFCSVLIYLIWKDKITGWKYFLAGFLLLFSLAIGISRIVLRYHYASDVLAGFCLGFAWVLFSFWIQKKVLRK